MLAAAIAGAEGDQPGILGVGQRHPRFGDLRQPGHRGAAAQHLRGRDDGKIGAPSRQRRLGRRQRQHQRRRQQRRQLGQRHCGQFGAGRGDRFGTEARRLDTERGCWIGEVADHRGR